MPSISTALNSTGSAEAGSAAKAIDDNDNKGAATRIVITEVFISHTPKITGCKNLKREHAVRRESLLL
jgi:hypothetical protein